MAGAFSSAFSSAFDVGAGTSIIPLVSHHLTLLESDMQILKQSTQIKVRIGPFVDATDGVTPETGVDLTTADQAELLKNNGAATVDISAATWAAVTGADGWYDLTLTTSHTDTVGTLEVVVQDSSLCLPVFTRFQVVEEAIFDGFYAASATALPADAVSFSGSTAAADNAESCFTGTLTTLDALDTAQDAQHSTTQSAISGLNDLSAAQVNAEVDTALADYDAPTKAELDAGLAALNDPTAAAIADAVLDEALAGHVTAGTLGKAVADIETDATAILEDTGTTLPASIATVDTVVDGIKAVTDLLPDGGALSSLATAAALATVDTVVDAIKLTTDNLPDSGALTSIAQEATLAALNDLSAADILTAQMTESYAADGTAPTLAQALFLIQQALTEKAIAGTTMTIKKLDGSTTAATCTLDDATSPTSVTRSG